MSEITTNETVQAAEPVRNPDMDLLAIANAQREKAANAAVEAPVTEEPKKQTALERAIAREKENTGMILEREQGDAEELRGNNDTEESREGFKDAIGDKEKLAENMKLIFVFRKPENQVESAEMMTEVSETYIDPASGRVVVPADAKYIIPKEDVKRYMREHPDEFTNIKLDENGDIVDRTEEEKEKLEEVIAQQIHKKQIAKILVDKTGLGVNIDFTDEERAKLLEVEEIQLVEVTTQDLEVVDIEADPGDTSFMQAVNTYQLSVSKTPMTFACSGFSAEMCGLSWEEYSDIALDVTSEDSDDLFNFDKMYKKMSTIYNKMINISIGAFENFEDFLKKFAYDDLETASYGLLIATQPEKDSLGLKCNATNCGKRFVAPYSPRGIIDLDNSSNRILESIKEIVDAPADKKLKLAENSPVRKWKRFKLPQSGYLVDIGLCSCHDYLYQIIPTLKKYMDQELPDDDVRYDLTVLLRGVRRLMVPKAGGGYAGFMNGEQIIEALCTIPPSDITILKSIYVNYATGYIINYSLKDIKCPHCGNLTKRIQIQPDELVFRLLQRQKSTTVTFKNLTNF